MQHSSRLLLLLLLFCFVDGQIIGNELTMRSYDSVDIEVCADNILASEQSSLQTVIVTRLRELLSSTAVYPTRRYSATATVCFMFVFQARNPEEARESVHKIDSSDTSTLDVVFEGFSLVCRVTAVPWVGEDSGPLGLSWEFTASDVLLWGAVGGGTLLFCVVATCCFVQLTAHREQKRANALLAKDSALLGHHVPKTTTTTKKKKKKKKKGAEEEEDDDDEKV